jgi:hypothetical protein
MPVRWWPLLRPGAFSPVLLLCFGVLAALLAMHLALLPQGQWFDEYFTFSFLRSWGLAGVMIRLRHWSMRPVSELLAYLYCRLVIATGRPLIVPVLAFAWAILFGFLTAAIRPWRRPASAPRWALLLALPLLALLSAPVGELWYWPLGALAYLPALGAAFYAAIALTGPGLRDDASWLALAVALTIGAFSAELGMFLALLLSPMLFLDLFLRPLPGGIRRAAMMAVPFMAAAFVLISLMHGRASTTVEMVQAGTFHRALPSLLAAMPRVLRGLAGVGDTGWETARAIASRALLAAGSAALLRQAWPNPVPRARVAMLLAALAGAALLSIAGAFYQFGVLCCERHEAFRQGLYLLIAMAAPALLPRRPLLPGKALPWLSTPLSAPVLLTLSCLVAAPPRLPALLAQYRAGPALIAARNTLFASGHDPAHDTLIMVLPRPGPLLQAYHMEQGEYSMAKQPPWFVQGPMLFFGKTKMVVTAAAPKAGPAP